MPRSPKWCLPFFLSFYVFYSFLLACCSYTTVSFIGRTDVKWTHVAWIRLGVACSYSWSISAACGFNVFWYLFHINVFAKKSIFSFQIIQPQGESRRWLYHSSKAYVGQTGRMPWHVTRYEYYIQNYPRLNVQGFHLFHSPFISIVTRFSVKVTSVLYQLEYTRVFVSYEYTVTHWKHVGL